jgi:hypothetical protein
MHGQQAKIEATLDAHALTLDVSIEGKLTPVKAVATVDADFTDPKPAGQKSVTPGPFSKLAGKHNIDPRISPEGATRR